jgi:WD40 repeat protein
MAGTANQRARVVSHQFGAYVVAAAANGRLFGLSFGDGNVRLIDSETLDGKPIEVEAHKGASLCLAADIDKGAFLSGGDDGKLVRVTPVGAAEILAEHKGRWIEHVTAHVGSGVRVFAIGKDALVLAKQKGEPRKLSHATSVGGLAINPKGKRLAVSHYNGVSLWWLAQQSAPTVLEWKGSHLNVAWSPDGDYVMTAMQENALHGWHLADGEHMRMSGYDAKVRSIAFSRRGQYLATGGSERVICWPFTGGGPMGKAPLEFGGAGGAPVTAVAANPQIDVMAAGFDDGTVIVGQPGPTAAKLIVMGGGSPVTALCWNPDGDRLLAGTEAGDVHIADFRA